MRIKGIRHTCLAVKDMEEMVKFYQGLGMTKIVRDRIEQGEYLSSSLGTLGAMAHVVYLQAEDGSLLELIKMLPIQIQREDGTIDFFEPPNIKYAHVSYTVEELTEGAKSPYNPVKTKFIQDPEGNWMECVELV